MFLTIAQFLVNMIKRTSLASVLAITIGLFLSSCKTQEDKMCSVVNLTEAAETTMDKFFSKVEIVTLENKEDKFVSDVDCIFPSADFYVIKSRKNVISVYSTDGKYVSDSKNKIGNGPNEYSIVTAMTFNKYTNNIEIVTPRHLLSYDINFNLKEKVELPTKTASKDSKSVMFSRICDLTENLHLLMPTSISQDAYTCLLFDSSTSKIIKKFDFKDDIIASVNMQEQCLFDTEDKKIAFVPPFMLNYAYSFDREDLDFSKEYHFQFGKDVLTKDDLENLGQDEMKKKVFLLNCDKEIPISCFETSNHIVILVKKGRKLSDMFTLVYDKTSRDVSKIKLYKDNDMLFPVIRCADAACLFGTTGEKMLPMILENLKKQGVRVDFKNQSKGDTYILKYYLK